MVEAGSFHIVCKELEIPQKGQSLQHRSNLMPQKHQESRLWAESLAFI